MPPWGHCWRMRATSRADISGTWKHWGFDLRTEARVSVLTNEVVRSSAIEGEHLDPAQVRSSIARQLGLDAAGLPVPGRDVEGVVAMMLDATRSFDRPLTAERLFRWHAALFPTGYSGLNRITVGAWRTDEGGPMQVVSGPLGRERVHFQAPAATRLEVRDETLPGVVFEAAGDRPRAQSRCRPLLVRDDSPVRRRQRVASAAPSPNWHWRRPTARRSATTACPPR